jgi:hypothetical protein
MAFQAREVEPLENGRTVIQIDRFAGMPAFQDWWQRQRGSFAFDPAFVAMVDERVARSRTADA